MTSVLMGYTNWQNVQNFLNRPFTEIGTAEQNQYLLAAEAYIHNFCGYNMETTTSGLAREVVLKERHVGKIDANGNLSVDVYKPPINFDANDNPLITNMQFELGAIRIPLQLTDGSNNALNTLLSVDEGRRRVVYPSLYFLPAISTVTPTAKINLFSLRDIEFFVSISYTGGFQVIPADIVQATTMLAAMFALNRDNPNYAVMARQGSMQTQYLPTNPRYVKGEPVSKHYENIHMLLQPYVRNQWY